MKKLFIFLVGSLVIGYLSLAHAQVYKWTDKHGVDHFTDTPDNIPESSRSKAKLIQRAKKNQAKRNVHKNKSSSHDSSRSSSRSYLDRADRSAKQLERKKRIFKSRLDAVRKRITELEKICARLKNNRDISKYNSIVAVRPQDRQKHKNYESGYENCKKQLAELKHLESVELPEKARRAGIPPGWLR